MSKSITLSAIVLLITLMVNPLLSQEKSSIPSVKVTNLKGETIDTKDFHNDGKPFVINFWATWCKSCILELNNINDVYEDWQEQTGVKIIAISIDDSRNSRRVAPFVNGRNWKYEVYLDPNSDLKRAMNINNPPHTFLYNGKGELVWQHNGYAPGDEDNLFKEIMKISKEEEK